MRRMHDRTPQRARPRRAPIGTPTVRTRYGASGRSRLLFRVIPIVPGKAYVGERAPAVERFANAQSLGAFGCGM